ncbi:MAG: hypothetical protein JWO03_1108 [Bacteroidetes bacterium]|nr:hypothetical protein [Bacteroidota bacterium]
MEKLNEYFTERNVLTIFFPGFIAIYPLILAFINHISSLKIPEGLPKGEAFLSTISVVIFLIIFVIVYGVGYFIKRIAIRILETKWDHYIIKNYVAINQDLVELNNLPFGQNWYQYLSKKFGTGNTPIMISFYSNLLNSYHFELSCILSICLQCILMWILDGDHKYYHLFNLYNKIIITAISIGMVIWLIIQSKGTSIELFNLRSKIALLDDTPDVA